MPLFSRFRARLALAGALCAACAVSAASPSPYTYRIPIPGLSVVGSASLASAPYGILVPAYFDPYSDPTDWNTLVQTAGRVPLLVILNVNSGPGSAQDPTYVSLVNQLRAKGALVYGYVHTSGGTRALGTVEAEVAQYHAWYALDGVFVDEYASTATSSTLSYYESLAAAIRGDGWAIMGNPGTNFDEAFLTDHTADAFVDFEDVQANVAASPQPAWQPTFPSGQFAEIFLSAPDVAQAATQISTQRHAYWLYATPQGVSTAYSSLDSSFATLVSNDHP